MPGPRVDKAGGRGENRAMCSEPHGLKRRARLTATLAICVFFIALFLAPAVLAQGADKSLQSYYTVLENVFSFINENFVDEVDPKILYEGALKGMFESLNDPYSVFLNEDMMTDLSDVTTGNFGGVGLYISKQAKDPRFPEREQFIEIVSPIEDTPGWRAGLMPGDLIIKIEDETTAPFSTDDAVKRLRGIPDTDVNILVRRGGAEFPVRIRRAIIEVPTVKQAIIPGDIGYLRIIDFTRFTAPRVRDAMESFTKAKCRAVVIDLRNNPGGLLTSVVQVADFFLTEGVIVSTKSRNVEENYSYQAKPDLLLNKEIPMVVLINKGSASASEILAGALKDQRRAYLMGETSYGKGSVQQVYPLGKTGFKLTMSRYYTPSDANIDKTGIPPDLEVKIPDLSEEQIKQIEEILVSGKYKDWAETHLKSSKEEISAYVKSLNLKNFEGYEWVVERMIRDEISRTSIAPIFDLDYDIVLKAAVKLIKETPDFAPLLKTTKTVRQVQDEIAAKADPKQISATDAAKKAPGKGLPLPNLDK